jgi:hypothetical protein
VKKQSVQTVLKALNDGGVRYLVVGGLAVNAHGILRFTADMDLAIDMSAGNILKVFQTMGSLGYRPIVPITPKGFADKKNRKMWVKNKNMQALQFYSNAHKETPVDILVDEPFLFKKEYKKALVKLMGGNFQVRFVSLNTLLDMKKAAGRPKDLSDVDDLRKKG